MENASLSNDVWDNVTTSSLQSDDLTSYLANIRDLALKVIYIIIGTVGVIDNLFVLVVFFLFIKITDKTINILIVNQSVIDTCASFLTVLTAVVEVDGTRMSRSSIWDQFVCRTWLTRILLWGIQVTSTYGILTTAMERYVAVIYPIWYKQKVKKRMHISVLATIWVVIPAFEILMACLSTDIIKGVCVPYGVYNSFAMEKTISFAIFFVGYLLPLALMIFCYSRVVYKLRTKVSTAGSSSTNTAGRNAVVTSLMVCCGFIICWTTNQIFFFVNNIHHVIDFSGWFYHFTVVLALTNSCINPFIYAAKYREFQTAVKRMLGKQVHPDSSITGTGT